MSPIANSASTSYEAIRAAITMLAKLNRRWRKTGRKRALYRYLQTVFDLYTAWKRAGDTRTAANRMAKLVGLRHQPNRHPIRTIIDATSTAGRKSKSRWTQAFAVRLGVNDPNGRTRPSVCERTAVWLDALRNSPTCKLR